MTVKRQLQASRIRSICLEYTLYTVGNNQDYAAMFDKASVPTTDPVAFDKLVEEIATDILQHSDTEMGLDSIMFYLFNSATLTTVE